MNKFIKALLASIALYITFFVALITVNPFPVNNPTIAQAPDKYVPSSAVAASRSFEETAIDLVKVMEKIK